MKRKIDLLYFILIFSIAILGIGCVSTNKNYRDAPGILKTDTRSASGVNK